jgi:hypothetical protein
LQCSAPAAAAAQFCFVLPLEFWGGKKAKRRKDKIKMINKRVTGEGE